MYNTSELVAIDSDSVYKEITQECFELFMKKLYDYGPSWKLFRPSSLTDQILIKGNRIRKIQDTGVNLVGECIYDEFVAIFNYCAIYCLMNDPKNKIYPDTTYSEFYDMFEKVLEEGYNLMVKKNHDYGESWRDIRITSITDIILVKLYRIRQIEDNNGETTVSEGIRSNYLDILNYAAFCLIKIRFSL